MGRANLWFWLEWEQLVGLLYLPSDLSRLTRSLFLLISARKDPEVELSLRDRMMNGACAVPVLAF